LENKQNRKRHDNDEIYEDLAQVADFVNDRSDNLEKTALNNTVEEYIEENKGKD
jgi:uncharacterized protein YgfB (UPF0149 family)